MSSISGLLMLGFTLFMDMDMGQLEWLKYLAPSGGGIVLYILYNYYNSKRKYDIQEMDIITKKLSALVDRLEKENKALKEEVNSLREEIMKGLKENKN